MIFDSEIDDVFDAVYYILEPHAPYIAAGEEDQAEYYLPPEVLEVLSWIALNAVLPVLVGVVTGVILDRFKRQDTKKTDTDLLAIVVQQQQAELERIKDEVRQALGQLHAEKKPSQDHVRIAQANLAQVLRINGLPTDVAESDADKSVKAILRSYWPEDSEASNV
jgi:hypothetical protein